MDAGAKGPMVIGLSGQIEPFGVCVGGRVPVGAANMAMIRSPFLSMTPVQLQIASDKARLAKLYR
jgi:hypothetical protein